MHRPIQTFKPRRGRYSQAQVAAIADSAFLVPCDETVSLHRLFGERPVILDIGFGMGDATVLQATQHPEVGILAIDVHTPGVGKLLVDVDIHGIENVRVIEGDAMALLRDILPAGSLIGIRIFFPDPWPKARHHKRRIISADHLGLMARVLEPGGFIHFATDWQAYADAARECIERHPDFTLLADDAVLPYASKASRPRTKFESRGIAAGRRITDLIAVRDN